MRPAATARTATIGKGSPAIWAVKPTTRAATIVMVKGEITAGSVRRSSAPQRRGGHSGYWRAYTPAAVDVRVSFKLSPADMTAAYRTLLFASRVSRLLPIMAVILLAWAIGSGSWDVAVGVGVWLLFMGVWLLHINPRRILRATPTLQGTQTWVLNADGLRCTSTDADGTSISDTEMAWAAFDRTRESGKGFFFQPSRGAAAVLPKRTLDAQGIDDVRALIAAHAVAR